MFDQYGAISALEHGAIATKQLHRAFDPTNNEEAFSGELRQRPRRPEDEAGQELLEDPWSWDERVA
jgi:hypothetical protein